MPPRIKKTEAIPERSPFGIVKTKVRDAGHLSFSYKFIDVHNDKFAPSRCGPNYLLKFLERMKVLCERTPLEVLADRSGAIHCKPLRWEGTSEPNFGLPRESELVDQGYELGISVNAHGRIHGFFIDSVFYVRWIDPDHMLC